MQRIDLTLPSAAENVALDEALLDCAESGKGADEYVRFWEAAETCVVAGRSTHIDREINTTECRTRGVPIVRRSSGGAAIVAGRGCLIYAVVLSHKQRPGILDITRAHRFVLGRIANAIQPLVAHLGEIQIAGTSDLVISDRSQPGTLRKFSGNSLRVKRSHLLYHGTILYDFDLQLISRLLLSPPRQPDYRNGREHGAFVTNISATRADLTVAIAAEWAMTDDAAPIPWAQLRELVATRFSQDSWNFELM